MIDFFFTQWTSPRYAKKLHNCKLYLCRGNCCNVLTSTNGQTVSSMAVPELECHQEEADTRLFLHAQHAASSRSAVVIIRSPDTDVAVIGCSLAAQIPAQVLLHTGTKERRRYISLSSVAARLGNGVCQALPGLHAFTGCDSTSAFSGRGKKAAFKMLLAGKVDAMQLLGQDFEVSDELVVLCEQFVACLYNKPDVDEINELRYQLFCANPSKSSSLPPTKDALYWHIQRANYQAALLRRALSADPFPSPDGHWWQVLAPNHATDPTAIPVLVPKWMSEPAAPERVLDLVSCKCTTGCTTQRCRCRKSNLHCSAACFCTNCSNSTEEGSVVGNDTMSMDDDIDEQED